MLPDLSGKAQTAAQVEFYVDAPSFHVQAEIECACHDQMSWPCWADVFYFLEWVVDFLSTTSYSAALSTPREWRDEEIMETKKRWIQNHSEVVLTTIPRRGVG
jgi:hypothetical protein